jgi:hypothetical protein
MEAITKEPIQLTRYIKIEIQGNQSLSSCFGHVTKTIYHGYPIYKFDLPSTIIDKYLPNKLDAFSSKSWSNRAKHHFFYSRPVIHVSHSQIRGTTEELSSKIGLSDLLEGVLPTNGSISRYNFVILGDCLIFTRVPHRYHASYHILCKHITLSNRSKDVRFAGEFWCDENYCFQLNNNSGTYRPANTLIKPTVELFNQLTPLLKFQGNDFQTNTLPRMKHRSFGKV